MESSQEIGFDTAFPVPPAPADTVKWLIYFAGLGAFIMLTLGLLGGPRNDS